uniref:Glycosyl transferase family 1 domain-containing protein n=1 Tax=Mola mola TaxID=94237 RepID=A0A3Q3VNG4_MOLML
MKILILACLTPNTGNNTTAERIRSHIEKAGHTCELRDAAEFQSPAEVADLLSRNPPFQGAMAIHLFRAGRLLLDIHVPFGVIFGGTDINEDVKVEQKRVVMEQVLLKASHSCLIFIMTLGDVLLSLFTDVVAIIEHVDELRVFLLVCGLRRVKDPLYLVDLFSEWHYKNPVNVLVIIGPKVTGVFLAQERSQQELHGAMKRCFAVVNSSISEGMSAAILEAMDLGVPVLARDIPGNAVIVQHEFTGLLYSSPQEFLHQSQRLVLDHELRERLVRNGKLYVEKHHSLKQERETYQQLVNSLVQV